MNTSALTRADVKARLAKAQDEIFRLGVRRLALFGSVERDGAQPNSDVDLLVEFEPGQKTFDHFLELGELLERVLDRSVDLVTAESLSPFLGPHILAGATDVLRAA